MPLWLIVLLGGLLAIAAAAALAPTGLDRWLNEHRWVLPAVSFLLVVVIALIVGGFSGALQEDQIGACERRNPEVVSEVVNLENDRTLLTEFRTTFAEEFNAGGTREDILGKLSMAIRNKSQAIGEKVSARALYSEHPGAKPVEAVIVDCAAVYSGGGMR